MFKFCSESSAFTIKFLLPYKFGTGKSLIQTLHLFEPKTEGAWEWKGVWHDVMYHSVTTYWI